MNFKIPIILASNSPRRQELLAAAGVEFEVEAPQIHEQWPPEMEPDEVPEYLARVKASALIEAGRQCIVIAADTVVIYRDSLLGKPANGREAFDMLRTLSGNTHRVVTGVCIQKQDSVVLFKDTTEVTFREISDREIDYYLENYAPFDKAGAYGIQEWLGMVAVTGIKGSYYNVMGLPVHKVYMALQGFSEKP